MSIKRQPSQPSNTNGTCFLRLGHGHVGYSAAISFALFVLDLDGSCIDSCDAANFSFVPD